MVQLYFTHLAPVIRLWTCLSSMNEAGNASSWQKSTRNSNIGLRLKIDIKLPESKTRVLLVLQPLARRHRFHYNSYTPTSRVRSLRHDQHIPGISKLKWRICKITPTQSINKLQQRSNLVLGRLIFWLVTKIISKGTNFSWSQSYGPFS